MGFALSDMQLTSTAFDAGGPIPRRHTGEGEDVSPAMNWSDLPDGTRSLALICHDPDAPLTSRQLRFRSLGAVRHPGVGDRAGGGRHRLCSGRQQLRKGGLRRPDAARRARHSSLLFLAAGAGLGARSRARADDVAIARQDRVVGHRHEPARRDLFALMSNRPPVRRQH